MTTSSAGPDETARKNQSAILRRLQEPGRQVALATVMGVSESTISRLKDRGGPIETLCRVMAHLGLKVVPAELDLLDPAKVQALFVFAKDAVASMNGIDDLRWRE